MVGDALLDRQTAVGIVRKAGVRPASGAEATGGPVGSFTLINDPTGYAVTLGVGSFPADVSMDQAVELDGVTEARLLATVASGGSSGLSVVVTGLGSGVSVVLEMPGGSPGPVLSDWEEVVAEGETPLLWTVEGSGSVVLGLVQLQTR